jgi:hypothetical protein
LDRKEGRKEGKAIKESNVASVDAEAKYVERHQRHLLD